MFGRVSAGRFSRMFSRPHSEGAGAVAFAAALPLAVLALAVTADYAKVSHFRGRVQQATEAASVAAAEALRGSRTSPTMFSLVKWPMWSSSTTRREEPGRPPSLSKAPAPR